MDADNQYAQKKPSAIISIKGYLDIAEPFIGKQADTNINNP